MEEKTTNYPIFNIDINNIKLSDSPQDDYQRLFFATLFEKFYQQGEDSNLSLNDLFNQQLRFKPNIYKSSLAKSFECPEYLTEVAHMNYLKQKKIDQEAAEIAAADKLAAKLLEDPDYKQKPQKRKYITKKDKGNENLKCFEYKLPDLKIYLNDSSNEFFTDKFVDSKKSEDIAATNSPSSSSEHKFKITEQTLNRIPINIRENLKVNNLSCKRRLLDANVVYDDTPLPKNDSGTNSTDSENSQESSVTTEDGNIVVNTLTKNQQFKVTKIYHNDASNNKLISKNNTVLWEHDTGFVFLTGIWRLYQDIIRGLILCQRRNASKEENIAIRDKCIREYDYISSFAFYESISLDANDPSFIKNYFKDQDQNGKTRKRRSITNQNSSHLANIGIRGSNQQKKSNSTNNNNNSTGSNDICYSDLHWNEISDELCELVRNDFKNHLINEQNIPIDHINVDGKNINDLGKRIRGGFIKIQGTWQPMQVAKRMCYRFCYPIRYLLIPVFGPDFVEECERWYKAIEQQAQLMMEERKRTGLMGPLRSKRSGRRNSPKTSNTSSPKSKRKISITTDIGPLRKKPTLRNPFAGNSTVATPSEEIISPETVSQGSPGSIVDKNNLPKVYISNTKQRGIQPLPSIKGIMDSISDYQPPDGHISPGHYFVRSRNSVPNVHFASYDRVSYYQAQPIVPLTTNQQSNYLPPPLDQGAMFDPGRRLSFENVRTPLPTDRYTLTNKQTITAPRNGSNSHKNSSLATPRTPDVNLLSAATNLYNTGGHRYAYPPTVRVTQHDPNRMYDFAPNTHLSYIGTPKLSDISHTVPNSTVQGNTNSIPRSYNGTQLQKLESQPSSNGQQYQNVAYIPQVQMQAQSQYPQPQLRVSSSHQPSPQLHQPSQLQPVQIAHYYQQVPQYQQGPGHHQGLQQQNPQYGQYYHYLQTNHMKYQQQ
ncbi:hypothetical protein C6P45_002093 [Maudiozyma exigua]|uniref:HTH APSES-type domain-containing protein n=1 Tax=Maudiozyma exigua TaxID=34358 RepID=A0A9P7B459_MAUEX|nr:hypothetical protein C6P45_002093 [Kazachstania exigua]